MDFTELNNLSTEYNSNKKFNEVDYYEEVFDIQYTHETTAMEGNTLTLVQTKLVLQDKISVGGKSMREVYEVTNHSAAFGYVKECVKHKKELNEEIVLTIYKILMDRILYGGNYRQVNVMIGGSAHEPPVSEKVPAAMKLFCEELFDKNRICGMSEGIHAIELAAWTHAKFVNIHPFQDGNTTIGHQLKTA